MADYVRGQDILSALKYYFFKVNPNSVADIGEKLAACHNIMEVLRVGLDAESVKAQNPVELLNALGDNIIQDQLPPQVGVLPGEQANY
jgi:hypothetical protein